MKPADKFKVLIGGFVQPVLHQHGYSRKGLTFYLSRNKNYGLLTFQRSTKSNADAIVFTVNIGTSSRRLLQFFSPEQRGASPLMDECHWRERLGFLLPDAQDKWWLIDTDTDIESLASELCELVTRLALPEIEKNIQDEALRDLWLSGRSPGLTNFQRLMNLSVMVKELGPASESERVVNELLQVSQGKPVAFVTERHFRRLEGKGQ